MAIPTKPLELVGNLDGRRAEGKVKCSIRYAKVGKVSKLRYIRKYSTDYCTQHSTVLYDYHGI